MPASENDTPVDKKFQDAAKENQTLPDHLTTDQLAILSEKLERLEKVVRGMARENLTLSRGQRELQSGLESIQGQFSDLDLNLKGVSQSVWKATQESNRALQEAEEHYAGALRELEKRVRDEIQWQTNRSTMKAILPAIDDLDLVLAHQDKLSDGQGDQNHFIQAVKQVRRKLTEGLRTIGFEEIQIETGSTQFDPEIHEAVEADISNQIFTEIAARPGTIVFVRRAGFEFQGRVFRVPQVIVKSTNE